MSSSVRVGLCALVLAISHIAVAGSMLDFFKAVVESDTLKNMVATNEASGFVLKDIKHKATMRCRGCFEFDIVFENETRSILSEKISTELDRTGRIFVGIPPQ